jgi:hypothetical protein
MTQRAGPVGDQSLGRHGRAINAGGAGGGPRGRTLGKRASVPMGAAGGTRLWLARWGTW